MFRLIDGGLELSEVAEGVDIDRDFLEHLPFTPKIDTPKRRSPALFGESRIGLRQLISELSLDKRISCSPEINMLLLD